MRRVIGKYERRLEALIHSYILTASSEINRSEALSL